MATPPIQHTQGPTGARRHLHSAQSTGRARTDALRLASLRGQGTVSSGEAGASVTHDAEPSGDIVSAARSAVPVLVTAATSAERLACARLIHRTSARQAFPFVAVSCDASRRLGVTQPRDGKLSGLPPDGHAADLRVWLARGLGGTLFIDTLEQMSQRWQRQLATALEDAAVPHLHQCSPSVARTTRLITGARLSWFAEPASPAWNTSLFYRLNIIRVDGAGQSEPGAVSASAHVSTGRLTTS